MKVTRRFLWRNCEICVRFIRANFAATKGECTGARRITVELADSLRWNFNTVLEKKKWNPTRFDSCPFSSRDKIRSQTASSIYSYACRTCRPSRSKLSFLSDVRLDRPEVNLQMRRHNCPVGRPERKFLINITDMEKIHSSSRRETKLPEVFASRKNHH